MLWVPGLHFDEAWQGLYAHRIASEKGFWPLEAMNGYTSPISHYILAAFFKVFRPSLEVMRQSIGLMNLTTLLIFTLLLWKEGHRTAAAVFTWIWALLPLSVHNHRFYIEMTSFLGLCFALNAWALVRAAKKYVLDRKTLALFLIPMILGLLSHIGYLSVLLAFASFLVITQQGLQKFLRPLSLLFIFAAGLLFKMSSQLQKISPAILGTVLLGLSLAFIFRPDKFLKQRPWVLQSALLKISVASCFVISFFYIFFLWDGFWPYMQATGHLPKFWLPINSALLMSCLGWHISRKPGTDLLQKVLLFTFLQFLMMTVLIFKQSPRYYMLTTICLMIFVSLVAEEILRTKYFKSVFAAFAIFSLWNFFAFENFYLQQYHSQPGDDGVVRFLFFKDSGRDFRPFQKVYRWFARSGCLTELDSIEDDRFLRPFEFLNLAPSHALLTEAVQFEEAALPRAAENFSPHAPPVCPWTKGQMYFSHYPSNSGVELIPVVQHKSWGDLTLFTKNKVRN